MKKQITEQTRKKMSLARIGKKWPEETKRKISENKKKWFKENPNYKNLGEFKKGIVPWSKINGNPKVREEKHYKWKGGGHATARRILIREGFRDLNTCQICKDKGKMCIHHIDGNIRNNNNFNLGIVCTYCHNAIHDNGKETRFKPKELIII